MLRKFIAPLLAASALALTAAPAHAGKEDRARAAIAAAEAKIHTADTLGAGTQMPKDAANARAALATAREHFSADRNAESIAAAIRAQSLADAAIGRLQQQKQQALTDERATADIASTQAQQAQQQAADANARAAVAERSAATAAAEAQSARSALAAQQAAQVETTVTTQQPAARSTAARATKTTVKRTTARRSVAPSGQVTTTTTVTQRAP